MSSASGRKGRPADREKVMSWLSKVFALNPAGLNWPRAVLFLDVTLVPLVVCWAIGHEEYLLSALYFTRAVAIAIFISVPLTPWSVYVFGAVIGFLWLGTVPLTSGLIAQVFGVRYLSTLSGIAFLFHQIGSFFGVGIAGYLFDATGSYRLMWLLTIGMGVLAAILNLPIDDRQIARKHGAAATA